MSALGLDYGSSSSGSDTEGGDGGGEAAAVAADSSGSSDQESDDDGAGSDSEEEAARQRRKRQRANAESDAAAAASKPVLPGLGSVDDLFRATDTSILSSAASSDFVAPSLDVAADAAKAQEEAAARSQVQKEAAAAAKATAAAAAAELKAIKNLRDVPGGRDHKAAGSAKDWKTKEKLKRDRGQVSRGGSVVEEEKRILRQFEAGVHGSS